MWVAGNGKLMVSVILDDFYSGVLHSRCAVFHTSLAGGRAMFRSLNSEMSLAYGKHKNAKCILPVCTPT